MLYGNMGENPAVKRKIKFRTTFFPENREYKLTDEAVNLYKQILEERRKQEVLMLCPDLIDKKRSRHICDSAIALHNYGHKVTVITNACAEKRHGDMSQIDVIKVGAWIPGGLGSFFYNFFYFIRSLYSTFWTIRTFKSADPKTTVIFCETHYLMVPILKFLTDFKVIYFQYKFDYTCLRIPAKKVEIKNWFLKKSFLFADEILVPNRVYFDILNRCFKTSRINSAVCEPYFSVKQLREEKLLPIGHIFENINQDSYIFLVLGEFHPHSNFELAIDAFYLVMQKVQHEHHRKMHLIISGHCSRRNIVQREYYHRLSRRIRKLSLIGHVTLTKRMTRCHKKTLMVHSVALLNTVVDGLFSRFVLEAMALGRPIIGTDSGFTNEVLQNGVTGYVITPTAEHFSAAMTEILFNTEKGDFIGRMANCEFIKLFSMEAFSSRVHGIVSKYFEFKEEFKVQNYSEYICSDGIEFPFG